MFTNGNGFSIPSPSWMPEADATARPIDSQWLWERGTPLGSPVVPEVQQIVRTSLASASASVARAERRPVVVGGIEVAEVEAVTTADEADEHVVAEGGPAGRDEVLAPQLGHGQPGTRLRLGRDAAQLVPSVLDWDGRDDRLQPDQRHVGHDLLDDVGELGDDDVAPARCRRPPAGPPADRHGRPARRRSATGGRPRPGRGGWAGRRRRRGRRPRRRCGRTARRRSWSTTSPPR